MAKVIIMLNRKRNNNIYTYRLHLHTTDGIWICFLLWKIDHATLNGFALYKKCTRKTYNKWIFHALIGSHMPFLNAKPSMTLKKASAVNKWAWNNVTSNSLTFTFVQICFIHVFFLDIIRPWIYWLLVSISRYVMIIIYCIMITIWLDSTNTNVWKEKTAADKKMCR